VCHRRSGCASSGRKHAKHRQACHEHHYRRRLGDCRDLGIGETQIGEGELTRSLDLSKVERRTSHGCTRAREERLGESATNSCYGVERRGTQCAVGRIEQARGEQPPSTEVAHRSPERECAQRLKKHQRQDPVGVTRQRRLLNVHLDHPRPIVAEVGVERCDAISVKPKRTPLKTSPSMGCMGNSSKEMLRVVCASARAANVIAPMTNQRMRRCDLLPRAATMMGPIVCSKVCVPSCIVAQTEVPSPADNGEYPVPSASGLPQTWRLRIGLRRKMRTFHRGQGGVARAPAWSGPSPVHDASTGVDIVIGSPRERGTRALRPESHAPRAAVSSANRAWEGAHGGRRRCEPTERPQMAPGGVPHGKQGREDWPTPPRFTMLPWPTQRWFLADSSIP